MPVPFGTLQPDFLSVAAASYHLRSVVHAVCKRTGLVGEGAAALAAPHPAPPSAGLGRLTVDQRSNFVRVWDRLPSHLREVDIDVQGADWTSSVIDRLGASFRTLSLSSTLTSVSAPFSRSRFVSLVAALR